VERLILPSPGRAPSPVSAPTELVSVERMILHYGRRQCALFAPTELVSVERMILHYTPREHLSAT
jgi:hypothetical protein